MLIADADLLTADLLIDAAGARAAWIAAAAARFAGGRCLRWRFLSAHGERGKLLLQLLALAFGALGFLPVQDDGFKPVVALGADVFKNRHKE
ncbi:MAG TPA: hypothetical protein VN176_18225 [Verrucomicrobiae bacterium]|nr:hypothetical protein [Verrucomicrobiae bacterium]